MLIYSWDDDMVQIVSCTLQWVQSRLLLLTVASCLSRSETCRFSAAISRSDSALACCSFCRRSEQNNCRILQWKVTKHDNHVYSGVDIPFWKSRGWLMRRKTVHTGSWSSAFEVSATWHHTAGQQNQTYSNQSIVQYSSISIVHCIPQT